MFTEESRSIAVTGSAENDGFLYRVNYNTDGKNLIKLHCNVFKGATEKEPETYLGLMFQESGNKQISLRQDVDMVPHLTVFNQILSEVNATLSAETKSAK